MSLRPGFTSEAELLSHLKSSYEKTVVDRDSSLLTGVQQLLSALKTFLLVEPDLEVRHMAALMYFRILTCFILASDWLLLVDGG